MSLIRTYLPQCVNTNAMYYIGKVRCYIQSYVDNKFSANEIYPCIYVGDLASASNRDALLEQGITHILSIFNGSYEKFSDVFTYKIIHINDDVWEDISEYFAESNKFIDDALKSPNNKVMIHCQKGISRSVTLLIAYKLWKLNQNNRILFDNIDDTIDGIIKEIKVHRSEADPNSGFIDCLKKYVKKLNNYE